MVSQWAMATKQLLRTIMRQSLLKYEKKAFLRSRAHQPIMHTSDHRESEWFEVDRDTLLEAFQHLLDVRPAEGASSKMCTFIFGEEKYTHT